MIPYIVDASVGIKWLLPEPRTREALWVRSSGHPLHVPSFFDLELTSVLVKKQRAGLLTERQATRFVAQLRMLPLTRHAEQTLLPQAYEIAIGTGSSVYDATYLALAQRLNGKMVTADEAFRQALIGSPWEPFVLRLNDITSSP